MRPVNAAVKKWLGSLDITISNAGKTWENVIYNMTDELRHPIMDMHVATASQVLRAALAVWIPDPTSPAVSY